MAYNNNRDRFDGNRGGYNKNRGYNRDRNFNNERREFKPKPARKTIPVLENLNDNPAVLDFLTKLQDSGAFKMLSVSANLANSIIKHNDTIKGFKSVARIDSFDLDHNEVNLVFFGKNAELADLCDSLVLELKINTIVNKNNELVSITGFDLVPKFTD